MNKLSKFFASTTILGISSFFTTMIIDFDAHKLDKFVTASFILFVGSATLFVLNIIWNNN
jgi:hypothetical protein